MSNPRNETKGTNDQNALKQEPNKDNGELHLPQNRFIDHDQESFSKQETINVEKQFGESNVSDLDDIEEIVSQISDVNDSTKKEHDHDTKEENSDESQNKEQKQLTNSSKFFSNFRKRNKIFEQSKSKVEDSPSKQEESESQNNSKKEEENVEIKNDEISKPSDSISISSLSSFTIAFTETEEAKLENILLDSTVIEVKNESDLKKAIENNKKEIDNSKKPMINDREHEQEIQNMDESSISIIFSQSQNSKPDHSVVNLNNINELLKQNKFFNTEHSEVDESFLEDIKQLEQKIDERPLEEKFEKKHEIFSPEPSEPTPPESIRRINKNIIIGVPFSGFLNPTQTNDNNKGNANGDGNSNDEGEEKEREEEEEEEYSDEEEKNCDVFGESDDEEQEFEEQNINSVEFKAICYSSYVYLEFKYNEIQNIERICSKELSDVQSDMLSNEKYEIFTLVENLLRYDEKLGKLSGSSLNEQLNYFIERISSTDEIDKDKILNIYVSHFVDLGNEMIRFIHERREKIEEITKKYKSSLNKFSGSKKKDIIYFISKIASFVKTLNQRIKISRNLS